MNYRALVHLHWWRRLGWALIALVVLLSLAAPLPLPEIGPPDWRDKAGHLLAYATVAGWYAQLLPPGRALAGSALALVGLGGALELVQGLTPDRLPEWRDFLANTLGVALGAATALTPLARLLLHFDGAERRMGRA